MAQALLNGDAVFGVANRVVHVPHPSAQQVSAYFGIEGSQFVYGGTRGRLFRVSGLFVGTDITDIVAAEATLLSYDDGVGRTFTDTLGRTWPSVVYQGGYQPDPQGPHPLCDGSGDWALAFSVTFHSPI